MPLFEAGKRARAVYLAKAYYETFIGRSPRNRIVARKTPIAWRARPFLASLRSSGVPTGVSGAGARSSSLHAVLSVDRVQWKPGLQLFLARAQREARSS